MAEVTAELQVLMDIRDAVKDLKTVKKEAADASKSISESFKSVKAAAGAAFAFFAGKQVFDFFSDTIALASKQQDAINKLNQSLKSSGDFSEEASKDFQAFASSLQSVSKFGDEVILEQIALAKNFGTTNKQAKDLVKAATELSAATGISLDSAVKNLGKTFGGLTGELGETVPALRNLTAEQLKAGAAIDFVLERFKGSAQAEIRTFSGAVEQASNLWGDFKEAIGEIIVENPAVVQAISEVSTIISELTEDLKSGNSTAKSFVADGLLALVASIQGLGTAAGIALASMQGLVDGIRTLIRWSDEISSRSEAWGLNFGIVDPKQFKGYSDDFKTSGQIVSDTLDDISSGLGKAGAGTMTFVEYLERAGIRIADASTKQVKPNEDAAESQKKLAAAAKANKKEQEEAAKALETYLASIAEYNREIFKSIKEIPAELSRQVDDQIAAAAEKALERTKKLAEEMRQTIADIAADPVVFAVRLEELIDSGNLAKGAAAAAVGLTAKALDGAAGAKSLIQSGAAAFADSFLPGIGGAVGSIVGKLAEGPEATKAFIREFVEAVPDIVEAIAESTPVLVEAFVDSMINEGGALRIGIAITRAMAGEAIYMAIGKQLGIEFGDAFHAQNLGSTFREAFDYGAVRLNDFPVKLNEELTRWQNAAKQIGTDVASGVRELPPKFREAILLGGFDAAGKINASLGDISDKLKAGIRNAIENLAFPEIPTPGWVTDLIDFFSNFKIELPKVGGGGGSPGPITGIKGSPVATGGTIPAGFPNDTFPARLTSGEIVVPTDDVRELRKFLANQNTSGGNMDAVVALLAQILTAVGQPQTVAASVAVNEKAFADIMLNLSRRHARLTA